MRPFIANFFTQSLSTKILFGLSLVAAVVHADKILMNDNVEIEGRILEYDQKEGLSVETTYGITQIKLDKIQGFSIEEIKEKVNSFEASKMFEAKLDYDKTTLDGFKVEYDVQAGGVPDALIYAIDENKGTGLIFASEDLGLSNEKYFKLLNTSQVESFNKYTETEVMNVEFEDWNSLTKDYHTVVSGYPFIYRVYTWVHGGKNYRILYWSIDDLFEAAQVRVQKFLESIHPIKDK